MTQAVALAIVFLSITVMTGFGGHISLAQGAFAAIGGFTVFQLVDRFDMPVLVGALIGAVIAAVVGGLLSLPLLRLNGIWIAIATLAFAYFFNSVMVKFSWVGGSASGAAATLPVPRPVIGPLDFDNDKTFLALALVVLVVVTVAVTLFGLSTTGRTLQGGAGQRGRRPVDRHLAGAGAHHRLLRLGVHRRARRRDGGDPQGSGRLRTQLRPVRCVVLARARRHVRRPHAVGRAVRRRCVRADEQDLPRGHDLRLDPA